MSDVTKSSTSTEFSVLVLITFLLKIDILGLAMLIWLYDDEDHVKYLQVYTAVDMCLFLHIM